jgi:hypothetical protein
VSSLAGSVPSYRPSEIATAAFAALSVLVWSVVLLSLSALGRHAAAPSIGVPDEVPIAVKPVLDLDSPLLKGEGGRKYRAKMPKEWAEAPKREEPNPDPKRQVSSRAKDDPKAIPEDDGRELADAGPERDTSDDKGQGGGDSSETGDPAGTGEGGKPGTPDGQENPEDPLKALAYTRYRAAMISHFRAGFGCGEVPEDIRKSCVPVGTFSIGSDGTVRSVSLSSCGNAQVDGAAAAAANGRVGSQVPPPPENYPEFFSPSLSVAYQCPAR